MNEDFVSFDLAKKLKEKGYQQDYNIFGYKLIYSNNTTIKYISDIGAYDKEYFGENIPCPAISQVLKWFREEKNIDVEIHAEAGMLGNKVYVPFISTYTEFTLETSPDVVRYRQKKFNPTRPLPHEIVPAHVYFNEWEEAAIEAIEYVIDNLI